jgi:hypothetical protein
MTINRPHIKWSTYWQMWSCALDGLQRLGSTPRDAYDSFYRARLAGNKR